MYRGETNKPTRSTAAYGCDRCEWHNTVIRDWNMARVWLKHELTSITFH
jgi:hypothetical protein